MCGPASREKSMFALQAEIANRISLTLATAFVLTAVACSPSDLPEEANSADPDPTASSEHRPNVLLIVADDMGFSDISPFGGEISTPTLASLANEGFQLTNFHVLPTCSPSRSVLLTGTDNHVAGLGTMGEFLPPEVAGQPGYEGYLNHNVATLSEVLRASDYKTYMVGKWHLGYSDQTVPHARGFDDSFVLLQGGGSHWPDQIGLSPTEGMDYQLNGQPVEALPDGFYSTHYYTEKILEWIERDSDDGKPFFAYASYTAPHDPLHAPREYIEKYRGVYDEGWDALRESRLEALKSLGIVPADAEAFPRLSTVPSWDSLSEEQRAEEARNMEVYAAMVDYLDGQIARIFKALKDSGEYENTLILFFSDNGANGAPMTAYPGQTQAFIDSFDNSLDNRGLPGSLIDMGPGWAQASMSPGRMFKAFTSEGGIHSPLLIKLPGDTVTAGSSSHQFVHIRDLMPTILDVVGVDTPGSSFEGREIAPMQGDSILALLNGQSETLPEKYSQVGYELFGMRAYIDYPWKILMLPPPFGTGDWELHNLQNDPGEVHDLSQEQPERLQQLAAQWEQYKNDNGILDISLDVAGQMDSGDE